MTDGTGWVNPAWARQKHDVMKRVAEMHRQREAIGYDKIVTRLDPPGEGWRSAYLEHGYFIHTGRCEVWRRAWGDETRFVRPAELPRLYNVSGLWWREA